MPENPTKPDPFKPQQPNIPGVTGAVNAEKAATPSPPPDAAPARHLIPKMWILGGGAGVLAIILVFALLKRAPASSADALTDTPPSSTSAVPPAPSPAPALPTGPGPIATTEELAQPWSAKKFNFQDPVTGERAPAMIVRLPGGSYWGFSLREPFGKCELEFVTDLSKLRDKFNYPANHPMVVNPCNDSVFELLRYGTGPKGLVRGDVVQGAAMRPPLAIEVRVEGHQVVAVRGE
jgi:hypothetical protein